MHPDVGDVEIYDDGNELTVVAGKFTHGHFSNYDDNLTDDQKAEEIAEAVASFLESLFADQVILWGSHKGSGGWYFIGDEDSSFRTNQKQYRWSGPLTKEEEQ